MRVVVACWPLSIREMAEWLDCAGVEPGELAQAVHDGYGSDFPLAEPVNYALLKMCGRLR